MNLSELKHEIWKDKRVKEIGLKKSEVKILVDVFIEHIRLAILKHGVVKLQGLFTIKVKRAKGRKMKNLTGETIKLNDYNKLNFSLSEKTRKVLKQYEETNE